MEGGEANRIYDALDERACAIAGCEGKVEGAGFLCRECWREVPDLLRHELREAAALTRQVRADGSAWRRWLSSAVAVLRLLEAD